MKGSAGTLGPATYDTDFKLRIKNVHGGVLSYRVGETFKTDPAIPGPSKYCLPD